MSVAGIERPNDVVAFCERRLDAGLMAEMRRADGGVGLDAPGLEVDLQAGRYNPVLRALWCEEDHSRCLTWLRSKAAELHGPLLLEQAIAECVARPIVDVVNLVAIPLLLAGCFRVEQDAMCAADLSVRRDALLRMVSIYQQRLDRETDARMRQPLQKVMEGHEKVRKTAIIAQVLATARLSQTALLPFPNWIGWSGEEAVQEETPPMYPPVTYPTIRGAYAARTIASQAAELIV